MKKILSIIAVLMLGMGIVSAQTTPTFSYQSVVVDNNGDLVVDATVDAHVIITYTGGNYEEVHQGVTTSQNGMIILQIGGGNQVAGDDFADINWKTATIAVSYTAPNRTISNSNATSVEPVPYAIQADGFVLNTPAITSYLSNSNTDVQDLYDIIAAVVSNQNNLSEDLKQALIDSLIANRLIAKDIMLYYIEHATVDDMQALYNALDGNEVAKRVMLNVIVDYIKQHRELVVEVLAHYASTMTPEEMNTIMASIPSDVKDAVVSYGVNYAKNHRSDVIYPILMEYVSTITTDEFAAAVQALEGNTASFQLVWNQFVVWMDEYFTQGGSNNHAAAIIDEEIANRHWVENCPNNPVDICNLQQEVEELEEIAENPVQEECPSFLDQDLAYTINDGDGKIVGTVEITGGSLSGSYIIYHYSESNGYVNDPPVTFTLSETGNSQIYAFELNPSDFGTLGTNEYVEISVTLSQDSCEPLVITANYPQ